MAEPEGLLDLSPDAVVVLDAPGVIAWINDAAARLLGVARGDLVGRTATDVLRIVDGTGADVLAGAPLGRRVVVSRGLPEREYMVRRRSGGFVPVSVRCSYVKDEQHVVRRMVCTLRPSAARRGMDMRTVEVISTVSHEIRSPLTSVKGFTKTLLDRWDRFDDVMKRDMLMAVNQDADRVTRLIGELLDISRLEAGRLALRRQRLDVRELAEHVVGKIAPRAERHTLDVRMPKSLPRVFADKDKVEQVLTNLVENAVKYTEKGHVRISARRAGANVCVSVSDEGEGIPPQQVSRLFRKFVSKERAGSPSGTGLGLYICKGLIEAHGGHIHAESGDGGTTFTFCIPSAGTPS